MRPSGEAARGAGPGRLHQSLKGGQRTNRAWACSIELLPAASRGCGRPNPCLKERVRACTIQLSSTCQTLKAMSNPKALGFRAWAALLLLSRCTATPSFSMKSNHIRKRQVTFKLELFAMFSTKHYLQESFSPEIIYGNFHFNRSFRTTYLF